MGNILSGLRKRLAGKCAREKHGNKRKSDKFAKISEFCQHGGG
jgi:hypothetical protein